MKKYYKPRTRNTDCSGNDMIRNAWKRECRELTTKKEIDDFMKTWKKSNLDGWGM